MKIYEDIQEIFKGYVIKRNLCESQNAITLTIRYFPATDNCIKTKLLNDFQDYCNENISIIDYGFCTMNKKELIEIRIEYTQPKTETEIFKEKLIEKLKQIRQQITALTDHKKNLSNHYTLFNSIDENIYNLIDFIKNYQEPK